MRRVVICAVLAGVAGLGALALLVPQLVVAAPAAKSAGSLSEGTYLIPANDGYGVADCIASNHACGKIVADAWCQTHGYRAALSYGVADRADFTGSVPKSADNAANAMPMVVNCGK